MYTGYHLISSTGIIAENINIIVIIMFILLIISIALIISLIVRLNRMESKLKIFMSGKDGISLEQDVLTLHEENKYLKACADKNKKDIRILYKKAEKAFAKIGLVKYDAFQQMGGKLSFSLALLDENNDGFIINSVHGIDGCYSYTKAIKGGVSELNLSKEEENALHMAVGQVE